MKLYIFDFDGTLFNSPVPNRRQMERVFPHETMLYYELLTSVSDGGLGWFQHLSTLSPPAVPQKPEEERWFVMPVLRHLRALIRERDEDEAARGPGAERRIFFFVLTGRSKQFQPRLAEILDGAGVLHAMERIIVKPTTNTSTIYYKLIEFSKLLGEYHPEEVVYFEDRREQGGKLLQSIHELQQRLFFSSPQGQPINPPNDELNPRGSCHLVPFTAAGGVGTEPLSWASLFARRSPADVELIQDRARMWASDFASRVGLQAKRGDRPAELKIGDQKRVFYPFRFTMVMVDPALALVGEEMFSDEVLAMVVSSVLQEG